jgi:hypothetical protein
MTSSRQVNKMKGKEVVTKQQVKDLIKSVQEVKQLSTAISAGNAITTGGGISNLSLVAQGDDINNRSGDIITMKELDLYLAFFQATAANSVTIRLIVFSDSMGSGGTVGITEFLFSANFTSPYLAFNRQRNRFKVFHDEMFTMVGATQTQEVDRHLKIPINQKRYFNDATANATSVGKNTLYLLILGSTTVPVFAVQHSLRFTDS